MVDLHNCCGWKTSKITNGNFSTKLYANLWIFSSVSSYLVQISFIPRKNLRCLKFPLNVNLIFRRTKTPRHMPDLSFVFDPKRCQDGTRRVIFTISQFASLSLFVHIIMMINFMQQFTSKDRLLFKKRLARIFLYQRVITHAWLIFHLNYLRLLLRTMLGTNN